MRGDRGWLLKIVVKRELRNKCEAQNVVDVRSATKLSMVKGKAFEVYI